MMQPRYGAGAPQHRARTARTSAVSNCPLRPTNPGASSLCRVAPRGCTAVQGAIIDSARRRDSHHQMVCPSLDLGWHTTPVSAPSLPTTVRKVLYCSAQWNCIPESALGLAAALPAASKWLHPISGQQGRRRNGSHETTLLRFYRQHGTQCQSAL
ncbi:hypothetical protein BT67DRAFT_14666 [Trichocladium antarcticum]|uniref:Uncharacterized protein n=1 Tax=Trichocladium antarcticum TaxID=1450529 RepID=A0AAN6UTE3_9PEZI|nr:hypothetical protein BT67DRAFT_14666 [Trichocladium antarcticum]